MRVHITTKDKAIAVMRVEDSGNMTVYSSYTARSVRYGECQKNQASGVGGYAVDGCREFMASGASGTTAALICAACGCHRNFHRRVSEDDQAVNMGSYSSPSNNV